jgi:prophage DNA circulation protein
VTWYEKLLPAAFGGLRFKVQNTEASGSWKTATELQVGRGSRPIAVATDLDAYRFDAFFVGEEALDQAKELRARLEQGQGTLVHPHFGAVEAIPARWSFSFEAGQVNWVTMALEFSASSIRAATTASSAAAASEPTTPEDARAAITERAADFDQDGLAALELQEFSGALGLDAEDEDYTSQAAAALLAPTASGTFSGTAATFRAVGAAIAAAGEGLLLAEEARRVERELLLAATRTNEIGILGAREDFQAFLRASGEAAIARQVDGSGRILPAVAVAEGVTFERLVPRNRAAVAAWFARGDVQL